MNKRELGEQYFKQGYNCAQSVVLAFSSELKTDKETLLKISSSFGGGIGRLREVCGAVSGMCIVVGELFGYTSPEDMEGKKNHYALIQKLANKFKEQNGTIICRELMDGINNSTSPTPEKRTEEYYKKRPCGMLVGDACEILEEYLKERS